MSQVRPHQFNTEGLPDGSYTFTIVDGVGSWAATTSGVEDIILTVVNGVPLLMFDEDGTPVTTEVP